MAKVRVLFFTCGFARVIGGETPQMQRCIRVEQMTLPNYCTNTDCKYTVIAFTITCCLRGGTQLIQARISVQKLHSQLIPTYTTYLLKMQHVCCQTYLKP